MKVLKWLVIGVVVLVVGLIGVGFVLPDTARIERSVVVNAKPATVFTVLNGFRQFNKWSPWAKYDPNAKITIEGPEFGVGAKQSWAGDEGSVGSGSQEIIASVPNERIDMKLIFAGFDSDNVASYTLTPSGVGTEITWGYETNAKGDILGRYFNLMLDSMLGKDYDDGLASLKTLVESLPQIDLSGFKMEVLTVQSQPMVYMSGTASAPEAGALLGAAYAQLTAHLTANQLASSQPPIAITHEYNEETQLWKFDAALIVDGAAPVAAPDSGIQVGNTYG
ncbi:MAG: SRPBCC family protein, partial [Pseudomonadota bacterium]|nr:SRPBCC family protein [Pseudomonadota bacterium]